MLALSYFSVQEALQLPPSSPKLTYRCLIILGTLCYGDATATELARDLDLADAVKEAAAKEECKADEPVQQASAEIAALLKPAPGRRAIIVTYLLAPHVHRLTCN
jgi:hypothetical protein